MKKGTLFIVTILLSSIGLSQGFLRTDGDKIVDQYGNNVLLRGMGLGGWMLMEGYMMQSSGFAGPQHQILGKFAELAGQDAVDDFFDQWMQNHFTRKDLDSLKAWGFNSVRLPMHYNQYTLSIEDEPTDTSQTWLTRGFAMTDSLLKWCTENEMYLILDLHAAPGGQGKDAAISDYDENKPSLWEDQRNKNKTIALWGKLAERYKDEPFMGGYDLINEVNWELPGNSQLYLLYRLITNEIRAVDSTHIIFIEGNWFANDFTGLKPPWDFNMVYSFHKYWSYNQPEDIEFALSLRRAYNVPLWCGESGENSNVWFTDAIKLFEDNNIGWAWWPMKKIATITSPYSIPMTDGYQRFIDYFEGRGTKPSQAEAIATLDELAELAKSENCEYRPDIIDAMIRQVQTDETKPYKRIEIPGVVQMADFDLGRNTIAYYDDEWGNYAVSTGNYTPWNSGWAYRNDAVDVEESGDGNGSPFGIGFTKTGEWTTYTVNVTQSDTFVVFARVASGNGQGRFSISVDGVPMVTNEPVANTGGWQSWQTKNLGMHRLNRGVVKLRFDVVTEGLNINELQFIPTGKVTDVNDNGLGIKTFKLYPAYPNPFNPSTTIRFDLPTADLVSIAIYDALGRKVNDLYSKKYFEPGTHQIEFSADQLASGQYLVRLQTQNAIHSQSIILLK